MPGTPASDTPVNPSPTAQESGFLDVVHGYGCGISSCHRTGADDRRPVIYASAAQVQSVGTFTFTICPAPAGAPNPKLET
jgi:hypothetical protein